MKLRVALFYDWLNQWGGAESVFGDLVEMYPEATIFTLVWDKDKTQWLPKKCKVKTSFINRLPKARNNPLWYTPFYSIAAEQFDFSDYDLLISTTSTVGHGLLTPPSCKFVCYFHNVNRYVYFTPKKYKVLGPLLEAYSWVDKILSRRPDLILCNSENVRKRINKVYGLEAKVVYPGVDTNYWKPKGKKGDYFLTVGRLVAYKRDDLAIEACGRLGLKLKVVGDGRERGRLEKLASKYVGLVEVMGYLKNEEIRKLYQGCEALICPQEEDFGLTPVEVQACGRGVVAYGKGGALETVTKGTGVFFEEQNVEGLCLGIKKYLKSSIDSRECRNNALRFSKENFMLNFKKESENLW